MRGARGVLVGRRLHVVRLEDVRMLLHGAFEAVDERTELLAVALVALHGVVEFCRHLRLLHVPDRGADFEENSLESAASGTHLRRENHARGELKPEMTGRENWIGFK
ncbi:hypothetical protein L596_020188 [Steinernema carpocapsae]|uniref:Uncharacterized protein n=1 Tax=Steinernema carpocapsae TaxID=34508 RepID=A0A4U5MSS7_STECR|nr:hypothetical protein L596_020188 [Steinernema carpocapsae]